MDIMNLNNKLINDNVLDKLMEDIKIIDRWMKRDMRNKKILL